MTFEAPNVSRVLFVSCLRTRHINKWGEDNFRPKGRPLSTQTAFRNGRFHTFTVISILTRWYLSINEMHGISGPFNMVHYLLFSKLDIPTGSRLAVRGSLKRQVDFCRSLDQKLDEFRKLQSGVCVAIQGMKEKN